MISKYTLCKEGGALVPGVFFKSFAPVLNSSLLGLKCERSTSNEEK